MKRRGFLGAIAAGFGLAATAKADPFEKYYKSEIIDRTPVGINNNTPGSVLTVGSGTIEYMQPEVVAGSGTFLSHQDIICSG
jgi:hypothetical protein